MTGAPSSAIFRAYLAMAVLIATVDVVNVFTALSDSARYGTRLAPWEPIVWEATSGLATLLSAAVAYLALRLAVPGRARWPSVLLVHVSASVLFSALHVSLMTAVRGAIYVVMGLQYRVALSDWLYEYRKDILSYALICGIFWIFARLGETAEQPSTKASSTFDIIDGSNFIRVEIAEISAVRAAGNYVEFILEDGRRPLMRAPLRQIEDRMVSEGFVRTHRSWLVNAANIRGISASGSGNFKLSLGGSTTAPLSRRYPSALAVLRKGQGSVSS